MSVVQSAGSAIGEDDSRDALLQTGEQASRCEELPVAQKVFQGSPTSGKALYLLEKGEQARVAGCWSRCEELARKVLQGSPVSGKAWCLLCGSLCNQRRFQAAEQECFQALSVHELSSEVRSAIADLMRTARLFARLQSQSEPAGNLLRDGWYKQRIEELREAGLLKPWQNGGCNLEGIGKPVDRWFQSTGAYCFKKDGPILKGGWHGRPVEKYAFPAWSPQPAPADIVRVIPQLDVLQSSARVPAALHARLQTLLDDLACQRQDFPMPQFQNIIDPDLYVTDSTTLASVWIPTDFEVVEQTRPDIISTLVIKKAYENATGAPLPFGVGHKIVSQAGGTKQLEARMLTPIPGLHSAKHHKLYLSIERLLTCALPMLALLRKPALLLPGPLQVVVKAQRIVLGAEETYAGTWRDEGLEEHVVAVVLYFSRASSTLEGGGLEFAGKLIPGGVRAEAWDDAELRKMRTCKVPVGEGTMVVFSNYELVHRVLLMEAKTEPGSRDFVAFFVIDQKMPLPDARDCLCELPGRWPNGHRDREGLGLHYAARHAVRMERLAQQVVPRKRWGINGTSNADNAPMVGLRNQLLKPPSPNTFWTLLDLFSPCAA